jgi:hypothetical protein
MMSLLLSHVFFSYNFWLKIYFVSDYCGDSSTLLTAIYIENIFLSFHFLAICILDLK